MNASTNSKPLWKRGLAVLLGLLAAPILIELALQGASLFVSSDRIAQEGDCLVLCQGDSHTYGLWLPPDGAYPAQLGALLSERNVALASVVNRGIPGKTTWQVLDELEADIERWNPRAVCLWAGVNDRTGQRPEGDSSSWWEQLRTVRMVHHLAGRLSPRSPAESASPELPDAPVGDERTTFDVAGKAVTQTGKKERRLDFEGRNGEMQHLMLYGGNPSVEEYTRWIEEDLERAALLVRSKGAVPLLLTYPVDDFPRLEINQAIERVAARNGVRLVDLRAHFEAASEIHGWEPLLYGRGHPKPTGYSIIARLVLAALVEEGVVDGPVPDPLEAVRAFEAAQLVTKPWLEDGRPVGVDVQYTAGHSVQVLFSSATDAEGLPITWGGSVRLVGEDGERTEKEERRALLADSEVLRKSLPRTKRYLVPLDAEGRAQIRMHPELDGESPLFAVVCVLTPQAGISVVGDVIELR